MTELSHPSVLLANRALDWLQAHLDCFEPYQGADKPQEIRHKALTELALLCLCLRSQPLFCQDRRVTHFLQFISEIYTTPHFHERLFAIKNSFVNHAILAVALRSYDLLADDQEWHALQKLLERSNIAFTERTPHGMLELRYLLDIGQFRHGLPSYAALCRSSIVSKPVNVLYITDLEAYSITHALFYLSDFGSRSISSLSPSQREHIHWVVDHLLGMYVCAGNWDLVGELILSCQCLGQTASYNYAISWEALIEAQWPCGAMPGPYYTAQKADCLVGVKRREYVFEQCYHTTLVTALAGALCEYSVVSHGA